MVTRRLVPNYNDATLYSLRGTVESHGVRKSGWWIFGERIPIIRVRLKEEQWLAFNRIARSKMGTPDGNIAGIAPTLELGMREEELIKFPVGVEVGVTFGYSGPVQQFFTGAEPLRVMDLKVIKPEVELVNEITVSA